MSATGAEVRRVLVTGAGLVGAHVAAELRHAGYPVTLVDLRPDSRYLARITGTPPVPVHRLDVRDVAGLRDLLAAAPTEALVHTAGLLGAKASQHPYLAFVANGMAAAAAAEAARLAGVPRLVQVSSLAVYDWPATVAAQPVRESFPTAPRNPYAASKLAGELAMSCYAASGWAQVATLRLAGVYGPAPGTGGARTAGLLQRLVAQAVAGQPVLVPARLAGHELLHVADAAAAIRLVLERGSTGVYNVGTGRVYRAAEVASALRAAAPEARVQAGADPLDLPPPLDCRRFRRDHPAWSCRPLATGLVELADAVRTGPWPAGADEPAAVPALLPSKEVN